LLPVTVDFLIGDAQQVFQIVKTDITTHKKSHCEEIYNPSRHNRLENLINGFENHRSESLEFRELKVVVYLGE
jgi:hypothetical protein